MARNKKVEILSNDKEVLHPMTDGDCVIFEDGQTLAQKLSEDDSVKYTPEIVNSSPMFKVGEGNTVDYSDNVLDGAYERATLQGQTYVNYIQESSADEVTLPTPFTEYERTQHNTLTSNEEGTLGINLVGQSYVNALQHDSEEEYVVLGESLEFQEKKVEYTNEGQIKSAMLKGQTLVNLCTYSTKSSVTLNSTSRMFNLRKTTDYSLEKNKKYIIFINVTKCESTSTQQGIRLQFGSHSDSNYFKTVTKSVGRTYCTFTTGSDEVSLNGDNLRLYMIKEDADAGNEQIFDSVVLLEYQEGMENWDMPYFEGMQSVTVSTRLENKLGTCTTTLLTNPKTGKTFINNDGNTRSLYLINNSSQLGLKPNTKYIVGFKVSNLVLDGLSTVTLMLNVDSTNRLFEHPNGNGSTIYVDKDGVYRFVMKTTDIIESATALIKGIDTEWENSGSSLRSMTISEIMYVEYQNGMENWDLPYFEDYQVMKPVQVESVSKNLFDGQLESGNIDTTTGNHTNYDTNADRQRTVNFIPIKPNTTYAISNKYETTFGIREYNKNKEYIGWYTETTNANTLTGTFTTTNNDVSFLKFVIVNTNTDNQIQLEESSTATEYVPHQSKTTYSWDEVILRKVGDVEDTLDLTTGEWVQRIGEIVLDGSDDETWQQVSPDMWTTTNGVRDSFGYIYYFQHNYKPIDYITFNEQESNLYSLCDKLPVSGFNIELNSKTNVCVAGGAAPTTIQNNTVNTYIGIKLDTTKATTLDEFKVWLKQNPLKVHVVMSKPIVHKVNLSRPNLQTYDDITHVHTKCLDGTLIPNVYLPSDISYPAILEPGKKYNVCVNHTEVSADNPLKVNVGGTEITMTDSRMTLTTPATLANSNVSFTGKGNKIKESMLVKNSSLLTRDLPHFNGIGSVQLGKTIENLCESKVSPVGNSELSSYTEYLDYFEFTISKTGSRVITSKLLKPLENGKKYFVYAPNNYPSTALPQVSFSKTHNGSISFTQEMTQMIDKKYAIVSIQNQEDKLYDKIVVGFHGPIPTGTYTIQKPIICEYEPGMEDWDWESIGYFTGTKNIGNEFMKVQNKNLFVKYYDKININNIKNLSIRTDNTVGATRMALRFYDKNLQPILNSNAISCNKQFYHVDNNNKWVLSSDRTQVLINNISILDNNIAFMTIEKFNSNIEYINVQLEESPTATTYTVHKHNGLYITKDQPIELTWEQGRINPSGVGDSYTNAINNAVSYGVRNKGLLNLKPNTTYRISLGDKTNFKYHIAVFDNSDNALSASSSLNLSGDWVSSKDTIFTTTKDAHKIGINVQKQDVSSITPSEINHVRLEEVTDVVLRGIGNVHDELDITRGIYTQRIGEVTLDGSGDENWELNNTEGTTTNRFIVTIPTSKVTNDEEGKQSYLCDKLQKYLWSDTEIIGVTIIDRAVFLYNKNIDYSINALRDWLQSNPFTVQYILKTPIVHKVHIGNKNEANTEVTKPNDVFTLPILYTEQTHIDLTNNGIMPKVQSRDYIAYPVLPMIGRTYTLQHNLTGGVSNLTVDLLGRTQQITYQNHKSLVYSPETMDAKLHNELRISGKGKISRVMYIDGGYMDRDIPYIEGMKNAVNPIVKNIGKNLISFDNMYSSYITNGSLSYVNNTITKLKDGYNDMQLYIYLINGKHYYFGLDGNIGVSGVEQPKIVFGKMCGWEGLPEQQKIAPNQDFIYRGQTGWTTLHIVNINYINDIYITEVQGHENCEPYKENICYVDCGEIRLTPDMFEQGSVGAANVGSHYNSDKADSGYRIRTKELIKLEMGEQYVFLSNNDKYKYSARFYDMDGNKVSHSTTYDLSWKGNTPFTILNDAPMCAFFVKKANDSAITVADIEAFNFQLVKVSEIKQLRSLPNGVHDEIDLENGTYIQRVGEITFNGTESWIVGYSSWSNKYTYYNNTFVDIKVMKGDNGSGQAYYDAVRCSQLHRSYMGRLASALIDGICSYYYSGYQRIFISKQDCATVDELKLWLKENPITVQYELPEPIIKDIVIHNYPHSYEGGHVIIENGDPSTPIPAQLVYRAVTNRSGQIQQHTEQVEKQEREINELETLILANIHLSQTR